MFRCFYILAVWAVCCAPVAAQWSTTQVGRGSYWHSGPGWMGSSTYHGHGSWSHDFSPVADPFAVMRGRAMMMNVQRNMYQPPRRSVPSRYRYHRTLHGDWWRPARAMQRTR